MKKIVTFILAAFILPFLACDKDDDGFSFDATLLTQDTWILKGKEISSNGVTEDIYLTIFPCQRDDLWSFSSDQTYERTEGETLCDGNNEPTLERGQWIYDQVTNTLTTENYFGSFASTNYTIVSLTGQELITETRFIIDGDTYVLREEYDHNL